MSRSHRDNPFDQLRVENEEKFSSRQSRIKKNIDERRNFWSFLGDLIELYLPKFLQSLLGIGDQNK